MIVETPFLILILAFLTVNFGMRADIRPNDQAGQHLLIHNRYLLSKCMLCQRLSDIKAAIILISDEHADGVCVPVAQCTCQHKDVLYPAGATRTQNCEQW